MGLEALVRSTESFGRVKAGFGWAWKYPNPVLLKNIQIFKWFQFNVVECENG